MVGVEINLLNNLSLTGNVHELEDGEKLHSSSSSPRPPPLIFSFGHNQSVSYSVYSLSWLTIKSTSTTTGLAEQHIAAVAWISPDPQ